MCGETCGETIGRKRPPSHTIAKHSLVGTVETGLPMSLPEKKLVLPSYLAVTVPSLQSGSFRNSREN
jgi:hypothetical protein